MDITITLTIAEGGQGEPHKAISQSESLSIRGIAIEDVDGLIAHRLGKMGIRVFDTFLVDVWEND